MRNGEILSAEVIEQDLLKSTEGVSQVEHSLRPLVDTWVEDGLALVTLERLSVDHEFAVLNHDRQLLLKRDQLLIVVLFHSLGLMVQ